jgi:septal ring factor EnvC (AmiA/AmiB activator)
LEYDKIKKLTGYIIIGMDLYLKKKDQMNETPRAHSLENISSSLDVQRSRTPVAPSRRIPTDKKLMFRNDFEEHKVKMSKEFESQLNSLKESVQELSAKLENSKTEHLKQTLNETIKSLNENIKLIGEELVKHLKALEELGTRVSDIESLLA